jgi:hypothetical protein
MKTLAESKFSIIFTSELKPTLKNRNYVYWNSIKLKNYLTDAKVWMIALQFNLEWYLYSKRNRYLSTFNINWIR